MKNKKNIYKKCMAYILVFAMTVTSIRLSAFADVITGPVIYNNTSFNSIEEALQNARDNNNKTPTIYIKNNIDFSGSISLKEKEQLTISSYTENKITVSLTDKTSETTSFAVNKNSVLTFDNVDVQGNYTKTTDLEGNTKYSIAYPLKATPFLVSGNLILNKSALKNYSYEKPIITLNSGKLDMIGEGAGIRNVNLGISGTLISSVGVSSISGGTITGMDGYKFGYPAAIKSNNEKSELTLDSVTFDNNLSGFAEGYRLIMKDCIVSNNNDVGHYISATYGYINGCRFEKNKSYYLGTVQITYGEILNSEFTLQSAVTGTACVYLENAEVTLGGNYFYDNRLRSVVIKNSKANIVSGEITSEKFGTIQIGANIFKDNTASALYIDEHSEAVINQAVFNGNTVTEGAAIYNNGTAELHNTVFSDNIATGTNSNNTNKVTKGDAVYNNGTLKLYSAVNFGADNIYECAGSQLIVKENILMHSETNKINIALENTVESSETAIAKYETDNSEEAAYQSAIKKTWNVESVSAKKNETLAAKGNTIVFNADTLDKTFTFVKENGSPITGVVYEITKKSNGKAVSLGYTKASDENGQITISGLYDGSYTATLISTPSSVESTGSTSKINMTVDTDNNTVTSGGTILADDLIIVLANFNPPPIAVISTDKLNGKINEEFTFDAGSSSDDTSISSYKWTFSDGTSEAGEKVTHSFTKEGTYTVTLTVKDNKGKTSTGTCKLTVKGTLDNQYKLTVNVMKSNDGSAVGAATVEVIDEAGKSTIAATDSKGIAQIYVNGNSRYTVNAYKSNYYYKTVDVYMQEYSRSVNMYLSNLETIVGEMEVTRLTKEEAAAYGVDTSALENEVCYKQETDVAFSYDKDDSYYGSSSVTFVSVINARGDVLKDIIVNDEGTHIIEKIKEGFYLAVQCDVTWMAEMFDVQLIVLNNSSVEEIQECMATLKLPQGLSLAKMSGEEQSLTVEKEKIATGETFVHHWIVKGDCEGIYSVGADVSGCQVSTNEDGTENRTSFNRSYMCATPIKVLGGSALNLFICGQSCITSPEYIQVQYALVNVSDINIYNLELAVSEGDTYGIGSKDDVIDIHNRVITSKLKNKTDIKDDKIEKIPVLGPGEAVCVSTTVYIGGGYTDREYYINSVISNQIGGNMHIQTISQFQFIASRCKKSIYESGNVKESESADPVDMLTGAFVYERRDASIRGLKDFYLKRTYSSSTGTDGVYGYGWRDNFTYYLQMTRNGDMTMNFPNGDRAYFTKLEDGSYAAAVGSELSLTVVRKGNSTGNVVEVEGSENKEGIPIYTDTDFTSATVTALDGTVYTFNKYMKVSKIADVEGHITTYSYNSSGFVTRVSSDTGSVSFTYDTSKRITKAVMSSGEAVEYGYDSDGYLNTVTNADGDTMYYAYDSNGYILSVTDFLGNESIINEYDDYGRVIRQYVQGEGTYEFTYDDTDRINTCNGEKGYVHTIKYDDLYRIVEDTENGTKMYKYDDNSRLLSETDANGNKTLYEYDSLGRIVKIIYRDKNTEATYTEEYKYNVNDKIVESKDKNGAKTYYGYDLNNRLVTLRDSNGNETNYVYDDRGNIILEVHSDGGIKSYTYDKAGRKLSETDENSNSTVYTYDAAGRTLSITASDKSSISYTYSAAGKLLSETDANGNTTTYTVNANGYTTAEVYDDGTTMETVYNQQNKTMGTVDRLGKKTYYTYDLAGNVTAYKNQRGFLTYYAYDGNGQLTTLKNALGYKWKYTYDANGNITKVTDPLSQTVITTYDANGNVLTYTDENGATTTYRYDGVGNILSATDANGNITTYKYDVNGNVIEIKSAEGSIITYTYDSMNRAVAMTDAFGATTSYTYDYKGQVKRATDSKGNSTYYDYDSKGRIILETDALGQSTAYTYDNNGNVTSVTKPNGGIITYTYDSNNNCISVNDERGYETRYVYGPTGLLTKERRPGGVYTYYSYYNNGKLKKVTYPDNTYVKYEYDAVDRLIKTTTSDGFITAYTYDALGRVSTETTPDGSVRKYTYDSVGNVLSVTDGDGNTTAYDYDALGQVTLITDANNGTVSYEYDANGNVVCKTDANGNRTIYTYDKAARLKSVTDACGNSRNYTYDSLGNVVLEVDESGNETVYEYDSLSRLVKTTNAVGETIAYKYDQMGHVVKEIRADGKSKRYVYDLAGNLTSEYNYRGRRTKYTYNSKNEMSSVIRGDYWEKYAYDKMGRVIKIACSDGSTQEYSYDSCGNVISYKDKNGNVTTYTYDSMNNMIQSADAEGTLTDYEYDINGNVTKQILHRTVKETSAAEAEEKGTNGSVSVVEDEVTIYAYDGCGNLVSMTDALGRTTTYTYDLNGNLISEADNSGKVIKTYTYDELNRVKEKKVGSNTTRYGYNNTGALTSVVSSDNVIRYVRDGVNRIISSTQNGRTTAYEYNELGQQTKIVYPDGIINKMRYNANGKLYRTVTANGLVEYTFDNDDNIITKRTRNSTIDGVEDPAEELEAYTYDVNGRLLTSTYTVGNKTVITDEYAYDYNGNVLSHIQRDVKTLEETNRIYAYDALNRLKTKIEESGPDIIKTSYEYDSVGNLIKEVTGIGEVISGENDSGGDLVSDVMSPESATELYGNAVVKISEDEVITVYTYNNLNQLVGKTGESQSLLYTYDDNGALTEEKDAVTGRVYARYVNDEEGRMTRAVSYTYKDESAENTERVIATVRRTDRRFDDNGYVTQETAGESSFVSVNGSAVVGPQRVEDVTTDYVYDYTGEFPRLIESISGNGTRVDYLYGQDRSGVVVVNANGDDGDDSTVGFKQLYNLSTDRNTSTRFATDREGNVVAGTSYGTWAEVEDVTKLAVSDSIDVDITSSYTGYVYNENHKLWNAGERVYSPEIKHFISIDAEPGNVYEKMRVNGYVYAGNNPTTYIDPDGRLFEAIGSAVTDGIGLLGNAVSGAIGDAKDWVADMAGSVSEAIAGTFDLVSCEFKSEDVQMALKLLLGTVGLAVGVAVTATTGGTVLPVVGSVAGGCVLGGAVGAGGYALSSYVSGSSFSFADMAGSALNGALDGYMSSGVAAGIGAVSGWYQSVGSTAQCVDDVSCVKHPVVEKSVECESGSKASSGADDIIQYEKLKSQYAADEIYNADRVGSALKEDPAHRAASYLSKEQMAGGRTYSITGGDNKPYTLLQVQGQLDGENGIFEYVMDGAGQVTHQRFIKGGIYTGFPNQVVPKGGY